MIIKELIQKYRKSMVNINYNSTFPDQVVPEAEKMTYEYGLAVGNAIEHEWFRNSTGANLYRYYLSLWILL